MKRINLEQIKKGLTTLTAYWGGLFTEAALFCLMHNNHSSGVIMEIIPEKIGKVQFSWKMKLDKRAHHSYNDLYEAVEYGATGIAILLALQFTNHTTVRRALRGTGFDFWIGDSDKDSKELIFNRKARLEISGIISGSLHDFNKRINRKKKQTDVSDDLGFPVYISVIEFKQPRGSFIKK